VLLATALLTNAHSYSNGTAQLWPGNLLHGVLPGALQRDGEGEGEGDHHPKQQQPPSPAQTPPARTTLVLAWWHGDPREAAAAAVVEAGESPASQPSWPRPVMALQDANLPKDAPPSWLNDLLLAEGEWEQLLAQAAAVAGGAGLEAAKEAVSPCWLAVAADAGDYKQELASAPLPPLRFFLPSADAIEAAYPVR